MDAVTSFVSSLSMPTFCSANDLLNTYVVKVADAIKGIDLQQHADAVAESTASFIAGKLAATTMLGAGAVLVLLPVVFGRKWLGFVITLLSVLFGIVGTSYLIQDQPNSAALFTAAAESLSLPAEATCGAKLGITIVVALLFTLLITKLKVIFYFALGAGGAGAGAYIGSGFVTPLIAAQLGLAIPDLAVYIAAGVIAVAGGFFFGWAGEEFVDFVAGLIGSVVMARGAIDLSLDFGLVPDALLAKLQLTSYYAYYVAGLAGLILLVRVLVVSCREKKAEVVVKKAAPKKGSPTKGKIAPAGTPGKRPPPGPPKGRGGKSMY